MLAGSVALCNFEGKTVYEALIFRPPGSFRVNTHSKNGFLANSLSGPSTKPIHVVQEELRTLIDGKLVIGVALANDFDSLGIPFGEFSADCFDLQWHYYNTFISPYQKQVTESWSLKRMTKELLGIDTQLGTHSATEDAATTMAVFRDHYVKIRPKPVEKSNLC